MINALHIDESDTSGVLEGISNDGVEELNKSFMENSINDHGEKPFAYGIATMNLSGVSKPEVTEPTKIRKKTLNLILRETQRDIILWQECKWVNPLNHINTEFLVEDVKIFCFWETFGCEVSPCPPYFIALVLYPP